jgi:stage V sporulation protein SpoVS
VFVGAVKLTEALPLLPVAVIPVGVPGAVAAGVTEDEALEVVPVPTALVATTVKVYAVPFVRPVTVIGEDVPVAVIPPGEEVTV